MQEGIKLDPNEFDNLVSISRATGISMPDLKGHAVAGSYLVVDHETGKWFIVPEESIDIFDEEEK
jgi:hypothetical protein